MTCNWLQGHKDTSFVLSGSLVNSSWYFIFCQHAVLIAYWRVAQNTLLLILYGMSHKGNKVYDQSSYLESTVSSSL